MLPERPLTTPSRTPSLAFRTRIQRETGPSDPSGSPPPNRFLALPASRAFGLPPVPGRTMWAVIVLTCAHCGSGHVHRSGDASLVLSGKLVRRCPATRERYRLGPVQRRAEARYSHRLAVVA